MTPPQPRLKRTSDGRLVHDATRFKAEIQRDGSVRFEDKPDVELFAKDLPLGTVRFDVNDALWRLIGRDPYLSQKRAFLKDTEGLRVEQARAHAEEMLGPALVELVASLEELVADVELTAGRRKAAVFELWDDCNDERAGRTARALIESFIRAQMPLGSSLAYSKDDLERLNRNKPKEARFSPYAPSYTADRDDS